MGSRHKIMRFLILTLLTTLIGLGGYGCEFMNNGGCGGEDASGQPDTSSETATATNSDDATDASANDPGGEISDDTNMDVNSRIPQLTPFGVSMSHSSRNSIAGWAGPMAEIGIRWTRGWQPFNEVEPQRGTFNWQGSDDQVRISRENNLQIIGMFNSIPGWLESPLNFPVRDLDAWSEYITEVVNHSKDYVKYWEVWNEPPNFCKGDACEPEDYAQILIAAYNAAKAADPDCQVGLAAKSVDLNYMDRALAAGAVDHFDFITLHPYELLGPGARDSEPHFMGIVTTVRNMLARRNPEKMDVPIVFTEIGTPIGENSGGLEITEAVQAHYVVKTYTMSIAQGVDCILWFEGRDGDSGPFGLITRDNSPRPSYTAMEQMIRHLGDDPAYLGWVLLNNRHFAFVFQGAENTVMVTWARYGSQESINFGQPVQIVDPNTGNTSTRTTYQLTNAPIMVVGVPPNLATQAEANQTVPFPSWDGNDYSNADAVSIQMGSTNSEQGLHHMNSDSSSRSTTSPYGASRFCGQAPTQNFEIDPNFLAYDTVPVRVTAVVRRNQNNDNAGFNLFYESTSGYKNHEGGWYTIPGNDQWYTRTWIIEDAQFVGKYGYNFALRSDSTQYSQYYLQSLSVELVNP